MSCVLYRFCCKTQGRKDLSIHVALIDTSEIIHKMLSHSLHYYTVEVHQFNNLREYFGYFQSEKPKLVFIDWEVNYENTPLIYKAGEQFDFIPYVLLYRKTFESEIYNIPKKRIPYRIKKPINPKEVRDICIQLIPELKTAPLPAFLKFPQSAEEKKQQQEASRPTPPLKQELNEENREKAVEKTKSFIGNLIEKTGLFKMPSSEEIESAEEFPDLKEDSPPERLKKPANKSFQTATGLTSAPTNLKKKITEKTERHSSPSKESLSNFNSKIIKTKKTKINKEDIKLDEDTQNDLAPMAIKSSVAEEEKIGQKAFNEQDLLQFFDKYKDSLEFQKLMEKSLAGYARETVANVLKGDSVKSVLKESLEAFKKSERFRQLVEKEVSQYIQKQLPLVIKSVVELEIKKIIGD